MKPVLNEYGAVCCINHNGERCEAVKVPKIGETSRLACKKGGIPYSQHFPDLSFRPNFDCPIEKEREGKR